MTDMDESIRNIRDGRYYRVKDMARLMPRMFYGTGTAYMTAAKSLRQPGDNTVRHIAVYLLGTAVELFYKTLLLQDGTLDIMAGEGGTGKHKTHDLKRLHQDLPENARLHIEGKCARWQLDVGLTIQFEDLLYLLSPLSEAKYPIALSPREHTVMRRRIAILNQPQGEVDEGSFWLGNTADRRVFELGQRLANLIQGMCETVYAHMLQKEGS